MGQMSSDGHNRSFANGGFPVLIQDTHGMRDIPPFKLEPQPLSEEAAALPPFKWAGGDIGRRHRLGGRQTLFRAKTFLRARARSPCASTRSWTPSTTSSAWRTAA
jgi:hypothetical protein